MKQDTVTMKFKIESNIDVKRRDEILYDIMEEIQDRNMYITEIKVNDDVFFQFDDSKFNLLGGTKE